jgi:spore coat protein CotF
MTNFTSKILPNFKRKNSFVWVYLKQKIYFNKPNNLEDLRQRIRAEMEQISPDIIERCVQSVGECQMVGGGQFQHSH